jgi:hypothetical protein
VVWNVKVVKKNKHDGHATQQVNPSVPGAKVHCLRPTQNFSDAKHYAAAESRANE